MVNVWLKRAQAAGPLRCAIAIFRVKSRLSTVNEFLSKRFKFSENSNRILIECAQKREQRLQPCLLAFRDAAA
jgi:hypothetical protein